MVHCRLLTEPGAETPVTATEHLARFGPADRAASAYAVVAFDVPDGTRAIRVSLGYDHPARSADDSRGNILDLGLLGPGPTEVGRARFRGWSGSERSTVVVAESSATPGYRPGPIEPGTWHVLLGLYQIEPAGCAARVRTETFASVPAAPGGLADAPPPLDSAPSLPSSEPAARRWIAADLHAHTIHSDGVETIGALAERAHEAGLDALFVTEHNTDAHLPHLSGASFAASSPVLLPGEEVTTYPGHFNALGIRAWVEFRHADAAGVARAIDDIHAQGAIASVNHPTSAAIPWLHGTDLELDAIEIWNGPWSEEDDRAIELWDALLGGGRRVVAVGGSDTHGPAGHEEPIGTPTTWVFADGPDLSAVIGAIRAGRVALTGDPRKRPPELEAVHGDHAWGIGEPGCRDPRHEVLEIRWRWPAADALHVPPLRDATIRLVVDGVTLHVAPLGSGAAGAWRAPEDVAFGRVRLEVRERDGTLVAITNHVFIPEAAT
jgi:predicted metal-dependent phosphoesterase TrpH